MFCVMFYSAKVWYDAWCVVLYSVTVWYDMWWVNIFFLNPTTKRCDLISCGISGIKYHIQMKGRYILLLSEAGRKETKLIALWTFKPVNAQTLTRELDSAGCQNTVSTSRFVLNLHETAKDNPQCKEWEQQKTLIITTDCTFRGRVLAVGIDLSSDIT